MNESVSFAYIGILPTDSCQEYYTWLNIDISLTTFMGCCVLALLIYLHETSDISIRLNFFNSKILSSLGFSWI